MAKRSASPQDEAKGAQGGSQPPADDVLTADEAAALLKLHVQTVRRMVKRGELPGRQIGGHHRFSRRQLLAWIEGREPSPQERGEPRQRR